MAWISIGFRRFALMATFLVLIAPHALARGTEFAGSVTVSVISGDEQFGSMANSVIIEGKNEVVLIDAQRSVKNALKVVAAIRATGKKLRSIFISHAHPDHYLGASVVLDAFPSAKLLSTAATAEVIRAKGEETRQLLTRMSQVSFSQDSIPARVLIPEVLKTGFLEVETQRLPVIEVRDGETESAGVVVIPSKKTLIAGDLLYNKVHLWLREARFDGWTQALDRLKAIARIDTVVPGHGAPTDLSLIEANRKYISHFAATVRETKSTAEAVAKMKALYPEYRMERFLTYGIDGYFEHKKP